MIALWGEHRYKPFAGACIQRLRAQLKKKPLPHLDRTLLSHQLEINQSTFPWLFPEPAGVRLTLKPNMTSRRIPQKLLSNGHLRSQSPQSPQLLQDIKNLSLTANTPTYIIPERDHFIWLLDRDPLEGDLLILRIDTEGEVLPPLVIFGSERWKNHDFKVVVKEEEARMPDGILAEFRTRDDGSSWIRAYLAGRSGYLRTAQIQFCAILPLDPHAYSLQYDLGDSDGKAFQRLESFLRIRRLLEDAKRANERWCKCEALYIKYYSPAMILCDNLKCPVGWYHNKCVGLDEDFKGQWFCKKCLRKWQANELADADAKDDEINKKIREASDARVQRLRTLSRIWKEHEWPDPEDVQDMITRTSWRIKIRTTVRNTYDTIPDLERKKGYESRCWALVRDIPKLMMAVLPTGIRKASGTNKSAKRITRRKSDNGISSIA